MANGRQWKQWKTLFLGAPKSLQMVIAVMKLKDTCSLKESYDQARPHIKKERLYFSNKRLSSQSYGFSSGHVWMWELDYTVHGILQVGILEWVAIPFSRGSSQLRDWTQVSHIAGRFFSSWATRHSATRVVSSAYLRSLKFLPAILIPAYTSSSQHFLWCVLHTS